MCCMVGIPNKARQCKSDVNVCVCVWILSFHGQMRQERDKILARAEYGKIVVCAWVCVCSCSVYDSTNGCLSK